MMSLLLQICAGIGLVIFVVLFVLMLGVFVKHYSFLSGVIFINAFGALCISGLRLSWSSFVWWFFIFTGFYLCAIAVQWFLLNSQKMTVSGYVFHKIKHKYYPFVVYVWLLGVVFYLPTIMIHNGVSLQSFIGDVVKHGKGTVCQIEDRKVDVCIMIK